MKPQQETEPFRMLGLVPEREAKNMINKYKSLIPPLCQLIGFETSLQSSNTSCQISLSVQRQKILQLNAQMNESDDGWHVVLQLFDSPLHTKRSSASENATRLSGALKEANIFHLQGPMQSDSEDSSKYGLIIPFAKPTDRQIPYILLLKWEDLDFGDYRKTMLNSWGIKHPTYADLCTIETHAMGIPGGGSISYKG